MKALTALYKKPNVIPNDATASMTVSWDHWSRDIDYGTAPVLSLIVHYCTLLPTPQIHTIQK